MAYLHKCDVCGDTAKWAELHGWVEMCWARPPEDDAPSLDLAFCAPCGALIIGHTQGLKDRYAAVPGE